MVDEFAERLSIYAGNLEQDFHREAVEVVNQFRAAHGHDPKDCMELETFFLDRHEGKHLKVIT